MGTYGPQKAYAKLSAYKYPLNFLLQKALIKKLTSLSDVILAYWRRRVLTQPIIILTVFFLSEATTLKRPKIDDNESYFPKRFKQFPC